MLNDVLGIRLSQTASSHVYSEDSWSLHVYRQGQMKVEEQDCGLALGKHCSLRCILSACKLLLHTSAKATLMRQPPSLERLH